MTSVIGKYFEKINKGLAERGWAYLGGLLLKGVSALALLASIAVVFLYLVGGATNTETSVQLILRIVALMAICLVTAIINLYVDIYQVNRNINSNNSAINDASNAIKGVSARVTGVQKISLTHNKHIESIYQNASSNYVRLLEFLRIEHKENCRSESEKDIMCDLIQAYDGITETQLQPFKDATLNETINTLNSTELTASQGFDVSIPLINRLNAGDSIMAVTFCIREKDSKYDDDRWRNYLQANIDAAKKGVHVERIFILCPDDLESQLKNHWAKRHTVESIKEENLEHKLEGLFLDQNAYGAEDFEIRKWIGQGFLIINRKVAIIDKFSDPDSDGVFRRYRVVPLFQEKEVNNYVKAYDKLKREGNYRLISLSHDLIDKLGGTCQGGSKIIKIEPNQDLSFRSIQKDDICIDSLLAIDNEAFKDNPLSVYALSNFIQYGRVFGLFLKDTLIGYSVFMKSWDKPNCAYLKKVAIKTEERDKGYGVYLLAKSLTQVKKGGLTSVDLTVSPDNSSALHIYVDKIGFKLVEFRKNEYGEGQDRLLVRLDLSSWAE